MRQKLFSLSFSIIILISFTAQCKKYPVEHKIKDFRSVLLKKPDKAVIFAKRSADFWKKTYDKNHGGFFTVVARNGDIPVSYYKTTLSQSRVLYAFVRAYMLTGDKDYLTYANYAADFLKNKCYDKKNGGFHTTVDFSGKNIDQIYDKLLRQNDRQKQKWSFIQHYALLGLTALADATRDEKTFSFLIKCRALLDRKLYDNRKGYEGYYESADYDWRNPRGKGFTPTLDCITTHGLSLYLLTNNEKYKSRLISLADNIIDHMYPTSAEKKIGFDEHFDTDWNPGDESFLFIGHMLKTAWCLQRVNLISPNNAYSETAEAIMHNINELAWDNRYGGPYYLADSIRGIVTDDNKNYWTLEQGITSGLINYHVTGNPLYLKMADESAGFFEEHIIDNEYGDVFDTVKYDGEQIRHNGEEELKGSYWKSAYHSLETAYYIYLYGNLYYHNREVTLYYNIHKSDKTRTICLNPLANTRDLVITTVKHENKEYKNFNAEKRILTVPAGMEGEFKVSYILKK